MIWRGLIGATLAIVIAAAAGPAAAQGKKSGLPIPRFVSLGSSEVNVRTGPGKRYPVSWMFVRRGLPVMVVDEFDLTKEKRRRWCTNTPFKYKS